MGILALIGSPHAQALELSFRASSLQLPLEGYQRGAASLQLGFGNPDNGIWFVEAGLTPPFKIADYTQTISFTSLGHEWSFSKGSLLRPFAGAGIGAYADQVRDSSTQQTSTGWMPALVTRAGVRMGSTFGFQLLFECQAGIYELDQLTSWVIWPMTRISGGLHVAF
jgi:hypothetical protein